MTAFVRCVQSTPRCKSPTRRQQLLFSLCPSWMDRCIGQCHSFIHSQPKPHAAAGRRLTYHCSCVSSGKSGICDRYSRPLCIIDRSTKKRGRTVRCYCVCRQIILPSTAGQTAHARTHAHSHAHTRHGTHPPSTAKVMPVTYEDAADARNTTHEDTSSTVPSRFA